MGKMLGSGAVVGVILAMAVPASAGRYRVGNNLVVTLRSADAAGDALLASRHNPAPFTGDPTVLCYEATLVDTRTDRTLGTGIDCLDTTTAGFVEVKEAADQGLAGIVTLERTTYMTFRGRGTLVARGMTSVSYAPGIFAAGFTHTVGDIPGQDSTSGLLPDLSTGVFAGRTGTARLSGAVDMAAFPGLIRFNCVFVVDMDRRHRHYDDDD